MRLTISHVAVCLTMAASCASVAGPGTTVRVGGDSVNLRAGPTLRREVVGQVSKGDVLTVVGSATGEWVSVLAPESIDLWTYGELVQDGHAAVPKLHVRCGPGINYTVVGKLAKGDRVSVRGSRDKWLKIAPPPGTVLWVSAQYLTPAMSEARHAPVAVDRPPPGPAVADVTTADVPRAPVAPARDPQPAADAGAAATAVPPAVPASPVPVSPAPTRDLIPSVEQGKTVHYQGVLRPAGLVWRRPSRYRLVRSEKTGTAATSCYVSADESTLSLLVGHRVHLVGKEYWLQGVRYPLVVATRVIRKD